MTTSDTELKAAVAGHLTTAQRAALDVAVEDLNAAAQPTKSEVFTACGFHAADLRDAIKAALSALPSLQQGAASKAAVADKIVNLLRDVMEDQTSTRMRFERDAMAHKDRVRTLTSFIQMNGEKLWSAVEEYDDFASAEDKK